MRLELEGDRNLLADVTSRSENGTLTLKPTGPINPSMTLRARIGRWLCAVGLHRWRWLHDRVSMDIIEVIECKRCRKVERRVVPW